MGEFTKGAYFKSYCLTIPTPPSLLSSSRSLAPRRCAIAVQCSGPLVYAAGPLATVCATPPILSSAPNKRSRMTFPSNHLELRYFESICSPDTRSCSLGVLSSSAAMAGIMSKTGIELTSVWSNVIGTREVCTSDEFLQLLHTIQSTSITPIEIQHEIPCIEEVDIAFRNVAVNGRVSLKKYIRHIPRVQSLLNSGLVTREEIDLLWADIAGEAGSVDYAGYTTMNEGVEACVIGSLDVNSMRNEWLDEVWIRASDVAACIGVVYTCIHCICVDL